MTGLGALDDHHYAVRCDQVRGSLMCSADQRCGRADGDAEDVLGSTARCTAWPSGWQRRWAMPCTWRRRCAQDRAGSRRHRGGLTASRSALVRAIVAKPPAMASRIALRSLRCRRSTPTCYGRSPLAAAVRALAIYDEPFWRMDGFNGASSAPGSRIDAVDRPIAARRQTSARSSARRSASPPARSPTTVAGRAATGLRQHGDWCGACKAEGRTQDPQDWSGPSCIPSAGRLAGVAKEAGPSCNGSLPRWLAVSGRRELAQLALPRSPSARPTHGRRLQGRGRSGGRGRRRRLP